MGREVVLTRRVGVIVKIGPGLVPDAGQLEHVRVIDLPVELQKTRRRIRLALGAARASEARVFGHRLLDHRKEKEPILNEWSAKVCGQKGALALARPLEGPVVAGQLRLFVEELMRSVLA